METEKTRELKFNKGVIMDGNDFRNAVISATEYMAFYNTKVCTFSEPIIVDGYKGEKKKVIPTICYMEIHDDFSEELKNKDKEKQMNIESFKEVNAKYNKIKKEQEDLELEIKFKNRIIESLRGQRICSVNINSSNLITVSAIIISNGLIEEVKEREEKLKELDADIMTLLKELE